MISYEEAFIRLEEILEKMNSGKLSLEDSIKLYEEADSLITSCSTKLKQAEEKIEVLIKGRDGTVVTEPFDV